MEPQVADDGLELSVLPSLLQMLRLKVGATWLAGPGSFLLACYCGCYIILNVAQASLKTCSPDSSL